MATTNKGKGTYVSTPTRTPPTRPRGIVIGALIVFVPSIEEDEEEPVLGGLDTTLSASGTPIDKLSQ